MLAEDFQLLTDQFQQVNSSQSQTKDLVNFNRFSFAECGGLFTVSQGNITSMHFPNNYESHLHCEWLIRTEPSHSISFLFNDFDLQSSENCSADVVKVYEGSKKRDDNLLLRVCGNGNLNGTGFGKPLISETSELLVVMESDDSFESKGFSATYEPVRILSSFGHTIQIYLFILSISAMRI